MDKEKYAMVKKYMVFLAIVAVIATAGNWGIYGLYKAGYMNFYKAWALGFAEMMAFGGMIWLSFKVFIRKTKALNK